ncbi:von Willebrand factor-like [Antedon mediterranea]|uniref:von Willebrand factor-like n=1 Tax=Antedon mediterranea TaxID=105859 RepID=UPI003AF93F05
MSQRYLLQAFLLLAICMTSSAFILNWFGNNKETDADKDSEDVFGVRAHAEEVIECPSDMEFIECGGPCQATCTNPYAECPTDGPECIGYCKCKDGLVRQGNRCIPLGECRCEYDGNLMNTGDVINVDCNNCTCNGDQWECTENKCGATCWTAGLGSFKTFDNKYYEHEGNCEHYLAKNCQPQGTKYEIRLKTENCYAQASGKDNLCRKSINIRYKGSNVRVGYASEVMVDGEEIAVFPWSEPGIFIEKPVYHTTKVTLDIGIEILFDEQTRVQVFANNDLIDATCGLCGTFNNNIDDEFLTPSGVVETDLDLFWFNWLVDLWCSPSFTPVVAACVAYETMQPLADDLCADLVHSLGPFSACHSKVNPDPYYAACQSDVCSCAEGANCHCNIYSQYAADCSANMVTVSWRPTTKGCSLVCPVGTQYSECHNTCKSSCGAQLSEVKCHDTCVSGCSCPPGMVFDTNGYCIPEDSCECQAFGRSFDSTDILSLECSKCSCEKGSWNCISTGCYCGENAELTDCKLPNECQKTCATLKSEAVCSDTTCFPGCQCSSGYVLDEVSRKCVLPSDCSCYHGGVAYASGSEANIGCKSCSCSGGEWTCNTDKCQGMIILLLYLAYYTCIIVYKY